MRCALVEGNKIEMDSSKLLMDARTDLLKRQLSNSENYDKSIITLSTAFLGFSIAYLKDLIPSENVQCYWLIILSWYLLFGAIILTIASFVISNKAIEIELKKVEDYYLNKNDNEYYKSNLAKITDWTNYSSGFCLCLGLLLTVIFINKNLERNSKMSKDKKNNSTVQNNLDGGAPIPRIQDVSEKKGAPIPTIVEKPQKPALPKPTPTETNKTTE